MKFEPVGHFYLNSAKMRCTDPCYKDERSGGNLLARPGQWKAYIAKRDEGDWGRRVSHLLVVHSSVALKAATLERTKIPGGVDSGQFGFFDAKKFPLGQEREFEYSNEDSFYKRVCNVTLKEERVVDEDHIKGMRALYRKGGEALREEAEAFERTIKRRPPTRIATYGHGGVIEFGAASSSGFGDGGYPVYALYSEGKAVALLAEYIPDDNEQEEAPTRLELALP